MPKIEPKPAPSIAEQGESLHWVDSHCHWDFPAFDEDREQLWQSLVGQGCRGLVIPATVSSSWQHLIDLCKNRPWLFGLGLHPYFLKQHRVDDLILLRQQCEQSLPDAIGEIGLDYSLPEETFELQHQYFAAQLKLAKEFELPVIIHAHKAYDQVGAELRRSKFESGGIVHAFTGSLQQGQALVDLGLKLGVGGAMSHPRAQKLRRTLSRLPASALVLETDAPDMTPAFWPEMRNTPAMIPLYAQLLAALQGRSLKEVLLENRTNLEAVFHRLS